VVTRLLASQLYGVIANGSIILCRRRHRDDGVTRCGVAYIPAPPPRLRIDHVSGTALMNRGMMPQHSGRTVLYSLRMLSEKPRLRSCPLCLSWPWASAPIYDLHRCDAIRPQSLAGTRILPGWSKWISIDSYDPLVTAQMYTKARHVVLRISGVRHENSGFRQRRMLCCSPAVGLGFPGESWFATQALFGHVIANYF